MNTDTFWTDENIADALAQFGIGVSIGKVDCTPYSFMRQFKRKKIKEKENIEKYCHQSQLSKDKEKDYDVISFVSVKRLSDNVIFSIGDNTDSGIVTGFKLIGENDKSGWASGIHLLFSNPEHHCILSCAKKVDKTVPLFFDENNNSIYTNDEVWYVGKKTLTIGYYPKVTLVASQIEGYKENYRYFTTESAAKEYILMNQKLLSLNDLLSVWGEGDLAVKSNSVYADAPLFDNFKRLAKQKINQ